MVPNNVCLSPTFLQVERKKNAKQTSLPLLHERCLYDGEKDLVLRPRARPHPCTAQHNVSRRAWRPTGRFAGVQPLVRPGDPGQSEVAGDRAAGLGDGGRHVNQHLQTEREHVSSLPITRDD